MVLPRSLNVLLGSSSGTISVSDLEIDLISFMTALRDRAVELKEWPLVYAVLAFLAVASKPEKEDPSGNQLPQEYSELFALYGRVGSKLENYIAEVRQTHLLPSEQAILERLEKALHSSIEVGESMAKRWFGLILTR